MSNKIVATCVISWLIVGSVFAEAIRIQGDNVTNTLPSNAQPQGSTSGCLLDQIPQSMIDLNTNVDRIIEEITQTTNGERCRVPEAGPNAIGRQKILSGTSAARSIQSINTAAGDIGNAITEQDFLYRADNTAAPDYLLRHQRYLQQINQKIYDAGIEVGSKCAAGNTIPNQVELIETDLFATKGLAVQDTLDDMVANVKDVMQMTQSLSLNRETDFVTPELLPLAPGRLPQDIRALYTQENFNNCELSQPETQKIIERIDTIHQNAYKSRQGVELLQENSRQLKYADATSLSPRTSQIGTAQTEPRHPDGMHFSQNMQLDTVHDGYGENFSSRTITDQLATHQQRSEYSGSSANKNRDTFRLRDVFQFLGIGEKTPSDEDLEPDELALEGNPFQGGSGDSSIPIGDFDDIEEDLLKIVQQQRSLNQSFEGIKSSINAPEASQKTQVFSSLLNAIQYLARLTEMTKYNKQLACNSLERMGRNYYPHNCGDLEREVQNQSPRPSSSSSNNSPAPTPRKIIWYRYEAPTNCTSGSCPLKKVPIYE